MDDTDREILSLRRQGLSLRQIASEVGISHVAVQKRLGRLTDAKAVNQQPQPVDTGMYKLSEYPDLKTVIDEVEQLLDRVEPLIRTELNIPKVIEFTVKTSNGWKIERG